MVGANGMAETREKTDAGTDTDKASENPLESAADIKRQPKQNTVGEGIPGLKAKAETESFQAMDSAGVIRVEDLFAGKKR